jgi:hypothetical protein
VLVDLLFHIMIIQKLSTAPLSTKTLYTSSQLLSIPWYFLQRIKMNHAHDICTYSSWLDLTSTIFQAKNSMYFSGWDRMLLKQITFQGTMGWSPGGSQLQSRPDPQSNPLPVLQGTVTSSHIHIACSYICTAMILVNTERLSSRHRDHLVHKQKIFTIWFFRGKLYQPTLFQCFKWSLLNTSNEINIIC